MKPLLHGALHGEVIADMVEAFRGRLVRGVIPAHDIAAAVTHLDFGVVNPVAGNLACTIVSARPVRGEERDRRGKFSVVGVVGLLVDEFNDGAFGGLLEIHVETERFEQWEILPTAGDLHETVVAHE